jgi:hypothetical protein
MDDQDRREDAAERAMRQAREESQRAVVDDRRQRIDVYIHFPDGIPIGLSAALGVLNLNITAPAPAATHAILNITPKGLSMPGQITVDTTNETATLAWVDDKGDTDAVGPAGVVVTYSSDNTSVVTIANDATNPLQGDVTVVAEGTANIGATITNADGTPVLEADGVTPFPSIASVQVTVGPGAAVGGSLVLSV